MNSLIPPFECRIYLLRKTSFTWKEIHKLEYSEFWEIYNELIFQESQENWAREHDVATVLTMIANTIPRKKGARASKLTDFFNVPYPSKEKKDDIEELAEKHNIRLPSKELKKRGGD